MVRSVIAAFFVLLIALPLWAQEDFPRIQNAMGYANLGFPSFSTGESARHSGFANQTSFNLTSTWGLDNYMGIYTLGDGVTLISDFFGGKAMYRAARVVPYALAGLGIGYFTASTAYGYGSSSSFATRYGGGFDVPINDSMAWKVEISRMAFRFRTTAESGWTNSTNFAAGIVFTLSN
jgi:hypothetical protein